MKISKIYIEKFRWFENAEFELGNHLTAITGQNWTQKTTILGILSQPFSISEENPMYWEKPLCWWNFKSLFSQKFKLSESFDVAWNHDWTLYFDDSTSFQLTSIYRDPKNKQGLRFWKKWDKAKGSWYVQLPVIYLSLKRLLPIWEDDKLDESSDVILTDDEIQFYKDWHNKILILTRDEEKIKTSNYLSSNHKQTLWANTDNYDWKLNSAWQDNISKILLAILSFKRLKEKYPNDYKWWILAIDELDATIYSGSQIKLIEALNKFASDYDIQIIFTTHSLTILEEVSLIQENQKCKWQAKIMFLLKEDGKVLIKNNISYNFITNHLNRVVKWVQKPEKIDVYTEDNETSILAKSILWNKRTKYLNFVNTSLWCSTFIELSWKIPSFYYPNSIIILDWDVKKDSKLSKKSQKRKNIILLPTNFSPEQSLSLFLNKLKDSDPLWSSIDENYDHWICFRDYSYDSIQTDREKAKKWFNQQLSYWWRGVSKVLKRWKEAHTDEIGEFLIQFDKLIEKIKK